MMNLQCAKCVEHFCYRKEYDLEQLPSFCPMKHKQDVIDSAMKKYDEKETKLYVNSTINEQRAYQKIRGRVMAVRPRLLRLSNSQR